MGYDIHITRKENWFDEDDSNGIALLEWIDYIKADKEMSLNNSAEAETPAGGKVKHEHNGLAVWTGYSKSGIDGNYAWFDFRNGNVTVKNPDQEIKDKMIDIAAQLSAKVQGDEGEFYNSKEKTFTRTIVQDKRPWWKLWG
jgi:hypothetical protein